jgi:hypothetical protein
MEEAAWLGQIFVTLLRFHHYPHNLLPLLPPLSFYQQAICSKTNASNWNQSKLLKDIKIESHVSNSHITRSTFISIKSKDTMRQCSPRSPGQFASWFLVSNFQLLCSITGTQIWYRSNTQNKRVLFNIYWNITLWSILYNTNNWL